MALLQWTIGSHLACLTAKHNVLIFKDRNVVQEGHLGGPRWGHYSSPKRRDPIIH